MFICTALDAQSTCISWVDLQTLNIPVADFGVFLVSIALVFATAWGFRLVVSFLLNR